MRHLIVVAALCSAVSSVPAPSKTTETLAGREASDTTCTVIDYASVSRAVKSCSNIVLSGISVPASSTLNLQGLQTNAVVTFVDKTTFGTTKKTNFDPIVISGNGITITGAPGHTIDGNGPTYWDGQGGNGGSAKPGHFIVIKNTVDAHISDLNVQNWPTHCFSLTNNVDLTLTRLHLDNSAGDAPNAASGGLPAAHNSDGFGIASCDGVTLTDSSVRNQDDCVAVTSGSRIAVRGMHCRGGHGLSVGSVGGKANNTVEGVLFADSRVVDSENGCRIKTNSGAASGSVRDVTYRNITLSGISKYGIDLQQDYLNAGPTGMPTNGVRVEGVHFVDVKGSVTGSKSYNYYVLCGEGSCSDVSFDGVKIVGGTRAGKCNFPESGCPT